VIADQRDLKAWNVPTRINTLTFALNAATAVLIYVATLIAPPTLIHQRWPNMSDPRGPEREILSKKLNLNSTVLTLSCGHKVKKNAIYTYNVGEMSHCIPCLDEMKPKEVA